MILLDANVLLELLIAGRPKKEQVIRWLQNNSQPVCITMLSVHLVLHFGLKDNISLEFIKKFLSNYPKIALLPEDYALAMELLIGLDHEDALQLAVAIRLNCPAIVTLDRKFASTYPNKLAFVHPVH